MDARLRAGALASGRDKLPVTSRYEVMVKVASGGMATVYVGRLSGAVGFSRLVAIKRAHLHLAEDPAFRRLLVAEAKLASRIHHPNVVAVQDVEESDGELLLVMDYVEGASLAQLLALSGEDGIPRGVATRVVLDACAGLHAAHTLTGDDGESLGIVHRDVSPHNVLVGVDGVSRIADFGIAKSTGHTGSDGHTSTGTLKGKVAYMAPEYVEHGALDRRGDVFALGVVAWELFARRRLFRGGSDIETLRAVASAEVPALAGIDAALAPLDDVVLTALSRDPDQRFQTALAFSEALETAAGRAGLLGKHADVARCVKGVAGEALAERRELVRAHDAPSDPVISVARVRTDEENKDVAPGQGLDDATTEKNRPLRFPEDDPPHLREGGTVKIPLPVASAVTAEATSTSLGGELAPASTPRPRSGGRAWLGLGLAAALILGAAAGVQRLRAAPASTADAPPSTLAATSAAPAPTVAAPGEPSATSEPAGAPSDAPAIPPAASSATSASAAPSASSAKPPRATGTAAAPKPASARSHVAPKPAPAKPVASPAASAPSPDKAPPNPYARPPR
jgi:eukaryotic-like serine/threonine-protein kinase